MNEAQRKSFYELLDAAVEDTLTDAQRDQLQSQVVADPQARRLYVQYLHQHAVLKWHNGAPPETQTTVMMVRPPWKRRALQAAGWVILASSAAWYAGYFTASAPKPFATLTHAPHSRWAGGSLPTESGSRLSRGRLHLADGLATVKFDSGAAVTLEGGAELELIDAMRCILHHGALVAQVPPSAIGFTLDTPKARLIDQGTSFGVNVDESGQGQVQVFEGIVDVAHRAAASDQARVTAGHGLEIDAASLRRRGQEIDESRVGRADAPSPIHASTVSITPAIGRGADVYIRNPAAVTHNSDTILLLKNADKAAKSPHIRKVYLRFDLGSIKGRAIQNATLRLSLVPTGWGYASLVGDSQFAVYGLSDESRDDWDPQAIDWSTAPANAEGGAEVDTSHTRLLGAFTVPAGAVEGRFTLNDQKLAEFLAADTNGLATLILVRNTPESRSGGIVHGFASTRHPSEMPPTLRVSFK